MEPHKTTLLNYRIQRAKETAEEAEIAFKLEKLRLAENRIYYAIFYIVHALSIVYDFSTSKHSVLKGWFNKEFVFTAKIDKQFYKIYSRAFDKRQTGDYDDFIIFTKDEVAVDLENMQAFLQKVEDMIKNQVENC